MQLLSPRQNHRVNVPVRRLKRLDLIMIVLIVLLLTLVLFQFLLMKPGFLQYRKVQQVPADDSSYHQPKFSHGDSNTIIQNIGSGSSDVREIYDLFISWFNAHPMLLTGWTDIQQFPEPVQWTRQLRSFADLFRAYEQLPSVSDRAPPKGPDTLRYRYIQSIMSDVQHKMFPWLKQFRGDLLSLKHSYQGRGIVMSVGNGQADFAVVSIQHLRWLGCQLTIEVFYNGPDDLSDNNRARLAAVDDNIKFIDISPMIDSKAVRLGGWAMKPFSILMSSFRQVLFVDADVVFLQDPTLLFSSPEFERSGTLFYKDRTLFGSGTDEKRNWLSSFLPGPWSRTLTSSRYWLGQSAHELESGVVLYDKSVRFLGILATCVLNSGKIRGYFYKHVHGDKETFWIAHEMIREDYAVSAMPAGAIGPRPNVTDGSEQSRKICSPQLLHVDEQGKPLWFNQWIFKNRFASEPVFEDMQVYSTEPGKHELFESNRVCFTAKLQDQIHDVSPEHLAALENIKKLQS